MNRRPAPHAHVFTETGRQRIGTGELQISSRCSICGRLRHHLIDADDDDADQADEPDEEGTT